MVLNLGVKEYGGWCCCGNVCRNVINICDFGFLIMRRFMGSFGVVCCSFEFKVVMDFEFKMSVVFMSL